MNIDIKAIWVAALRSDRFNQGKGCLKEWDGASKPENQSFRHCCLGVLCELAVEAGVIEPSEFDPRAGTHSFNHNVSILPEAVWIWAELPDGNPTVSNARSLAGINDGPNDFVIIADIIEREL